MVSRCTIYPSGMVDHRWSRESGGVLFTGLVLLGIAAVSIATVVSLSQHEFRNTERMLAWRSALPVAEAGVEEALAQLNSGMELPTNGWLWVPAQVHYSKQRTFSDRFYDVSISQSSPPVIVSTGYFSAPLQSGHLSRAVIATTREIRIAGIEVKDYIKCGSGGIMDSYDPTNPTFSTGGFYDSAKASDHCRLATLSSTAGKIDVGNKRIFGYVSTGKGGRATLGSNGKVGSKEWIARSDTGGKIEPGRGDDYYYSTFLPVSSPFSLGLLPSSGVIGTNNYTYVFGNGDYMLSRFSLTSAQMAAVTGKARLLVTDDFSMNAFTAIHVYSGGSIEIYCSCATVSLAARSAVNAGGMAKNIFLYGLPGNTLITITGGAIFVGQIYAPNASLRMTGTSSLYGHIKCLSADISGSNLFHADESVGTKRYRILNWKEL